MPGKSHFSPAAEGVSALDGLPAAIRYRRVRLLKRIARYAVDYSTAKTHASEMSRTGCRCHYRTVLRDLDWLADPLETRCDAGDLPWLRVWVRHV